MYQSACSTCVPPVHHHTHKRFELVVAPPRQVAPPTPRGLYMHMHMYETGDGASY